MTTITLSLCQVRELPQYHLIKAQALRSTGDLNGAIQALKMVMGLPGVKRVVKGRESTISTSERVTVYLELAEALRLNGEQVHDPCHSSLPTYHSVFWMCVSLAFFCFLCDMYSTCNYVISPVISMRPPW